MSRIRYFKKGTSIVEVKIPRYKFIMLIIGIFFFIFLIGIILFILAITQSNANRRQYEAKVLSLETNGYQEFFPRKKTAQPLKPGSLSAREADQDSEGKGQ